MRTRPCTSLAVLSTLAFLLAGCSTTSSAPTMVEVDVFSGRADPRWTMTDQEIGDLIEAVQRLGEPSTRATAREAGLGFRGFVVNSVVLTGTADPVDLTVIDGAVVRRSGAPATWADPGSSVLALLLDDARDHLDPADLRAVEEAASR